VKNKKILGVIPARGGSKGIPNKNIINLLGKPLINYSIEAALKSAFLTDCIVSTDDENIALIAETAGALVPFMRPKNLSTDTSLSLPVILHALEFMENEKNIQYDAVMMLQPTTPLRTCNDIDKSIQKLHSTGADSVISVVDVGAHHPLRMKKIVDDRLVNYIEQGYEDMRPRQNLPSVFIRNGAIYLANRSTLLQQKTFAGKDCRAYTMPAIRSINIDTYEDLILAKHYIDNGY
jgi:CMP-N-acetylneuraminic acid synthetase